jgi:8-oxo-dGTP pyrophosphatase MutT (NUDIX family)
MAVAREVFEEVGVRCREVRYLGDQPWPFPASLMLGFEARTDDPELRIDNDEIAEAHWVTRAQYREKLASGEWAGGGTTLSISRRLILRYVYVETSLEDPLDVVERASQVGGRGHGTVAVSQDNDMESQSLWWPANKAAYQIRELESPAEVVDEQAPDHAPDTPNG